jgi:hypothetical protein
LIPPVDASNESLTVSRSRCSWLFLLKGRMGRPRSRHGARRLRDRLDELGLGHGRPSLNTDAGGELDELLFVIELQPGVRRIALELARGLVRGCLRVLAYLLGRCDSGLGVARLLLCFVGELLRSVLRVRGGGARGLGSLVC